MTTGHLTSSLGSPAKPLVLLLDDNHDVLDSMSMMLHSHGLEARAGHDGSEGLDLLRQGNNPVIIISDYWLPGLNEIEFLKQAPPLSSVRCYHNLDNRRHHNQETLQTPHD